MPPTARPTLRIAVVTYRRPDRLEGLLSLLPAQVAEVAELADASVLVVDNDPEGSARAVCGPEVDYVCEPTPGIAAARNRALDAAAGADLLVFIDDDETPHTGWLAALVEAWRRGRDGGVAAVAGPVLPRYPRRPPPWIEEGPFHATPDFAEGAEMTHAATGNLLLDMAAIRQRSLRFEAIGTRGGEDTRFTRRLRAEGGRIVWCRDAVVDEDVPVDRMSPGWVVTRSMSDGNVFGLTTLGAHPPLGARVRVFGAGALRAGGGTARAAWGALRRNPRLIGGGVHTAARGLGLVAAGAGLSYDAYTRDGRRWVRER